MTSKAVWDDRKTKIFIDACLIQIGDGQRNGTTLSRKGWLGVIEQFNTATNLKYDKSQLKNKWDSLRKEWQLFHKLFSRETGLGWDEELNTVVADDEWWERKITENSQYEKYRDRGPPFYTDMIVMFKDVVAHGELVWLPSVGKMPSEPNTEGGDYRPSLDDFPMDYNEGSGDSQEDITPSANTDMPSVNRSERSGEKRKRDRGSDRKGKGKVNSRSREHTEALSVIAQSCRSRIDAAIEHVSGPPGTSIGECYAELEQIDEVTSDPAFHTLCLDLLLDKTMREAFIALKGSPRLVDFLRRKISTLG